MIKAVVTDIEGTTSSLSFVKDVLFPYARARMADFVRSHCNDPDIGVLLDDTARLAGITADTEAVIAQLLVWIDADQKATPLKALQGLIWEAGYRDGDFHGHVYADAVATLTAWKTQGLDLYVYSSGSIHAQQLLFAHTDYGDLTPLFSGYFDTGVGGKRETASYAAIARHIGLAASSIVFLSDVKEELDAARAAGMATQWLVRDAEPDADADHRQVSGFNQIRLDAFC